MTSPFRAGDRLNSTQPARGARRPGLPGRRACLVLVTGLSLSCVDAPPSELHYPISAPAMESSNLTLGEVAFEIGGPDGPFGRIVDLAVSHDSTLAVADLFGCIVHLVSLSTGQIEAQVGGCGGGPGELGEINNVTFLGDTLVVSDSWNSQLVLLSRDGRELDRRPLPSEVPSVADIDASGSDLFIAPWVPGGTLERDLVVRLRGEDVLKGLPDSDFSVQNLDRSLARWTALCAFRNGSGVVAVNAWTPEIVVLDRDLQPQFTHRQVVEGIEPVSLVEEGQPEGAWSPPGKGYVACGDSVAFVAHRRTDLSRGRADPRVRFAYIAVVESGGSVATIETEPGATWPDPATLTPAAGQGNMIYAYSNDWSPYPLVRGYRIVRPEDER